MITLLTRSIVEDKGLAITEDKGLRACRHFLGSGGND